MQKEPINNSESSGVRDRATRLIDYLLELAQIRKKIVREITDYKSIRDYDSILWFSDIPLETKYCFSRAWEKDENVEKDEWLEVIKYSEPVLEKIPDICSNWVTIEILYNTEEIPELLSSIEIKEKIPNPDADDGTPEEEKFIDVFKTLNLKDYPEVSKTWENFIETKWFPWTELYKRWKAVQKVYSKLFSIFQLQQKLGEKYELVLGIGILSWLMPTGHKTRRHLITAKAELIFEPRIGKFTLAPFAEGAELAVEFDMLDIEDHPPREKQFAEEELMQADDDPWNRDIINSVLTRLTNSLSRSGEGEFFPTNIEKPSVDKIQKKPRVDFSPALFLRERSDRGFEVMLKLMKEQILNNADIPEEFLNLCEGEITKTSKREDKEKTSLTDEIIYFPKHFNNEQLQIVEKLSSSTGVLVQGPPGTGKSHTIANLICHLLATGQRVLVTSKSPRALKVLNDQLPEKIRPLCISLLGNGIEEQKSLELSVNSILRNQDKWNQHDASLKVEELHKQLSELKSDKSEIENRLRSIREADSVEQSILGGIYQGTTANIAKRIKNEEADYEWIKDKISYDQDLSIPSEEIIKLHKELIHFSPDLDAFLSQIVPDPEVDLPSPDILHKLLQKGKKTKKLYTDFETLLNSPIGQILEKTQPEFLQELIEVSSKLIQSIEFSEKKPIPWIQDAIHDVYSDNDSPWSDLRRIFSSKLEGLKQRAEAIDTYSIQLPEHIDLIKILQNATQLKEHFDKGGKVGWGPAKARVVRENNYIIKDIKVNGNSCKNTELLKILIEYLSVEQAIEYCWNLWQGKVERKAGGAFMQVSELEELHKALEDVININIIRKKTCSLIDTIKGLHKPKLSNKEEIIDFFNTCKVASHKIELERIRNEWTENISRINSLVKKSKIHPIVKKALSALKSGNIEEYNNIFSEISRLKKESEKAVQVRTLLDKLAEFAPIFAQELSDNPNNIDWPDRLKNIEKGWLWKRAKSYLEEYLNKDDIPGLQRRLGQLENDVRECLEELSSSLAWKFCFSRMGDTHRRSLVGWEQAIRKLGKGTGKHAPKHRRDAQHHLNQCKDAIPAWIMPLHRVYDSVKAAPSIFDVVIIDEASQCGYEALPLTYLAKKILIVGDDKQISPEPVGIDRAVIFQKISEHLSDFEHKDSFDVESSLFDHGKRRFVQSGVVLLEHFRCMPEIIQFSNNHWYHSTLIPLRQYPPNHLDPIVLTHVTNGYREGKGVRIVNIPEAEVLVKKIIECCSEKRYADKTMGVIVLQGEAQAFQIEDMLLKQLGAHEMENRKLICGNPYSFQGDERDIIFLSMVTAPNERRGTLTKPFDQRRLNVACSRAKDQMWLFHSVKRSDLSKSCLRWKLLEYFEDPKSIILNTLGVDSEKLRALARSSNRQIEKPPKPYDSWFEVDVVIEVASRGYRVVPQYEIAGKRIDFVVEGTDRRVAIECNGDHWHGLEQYEKDSERQRMLERSGWIFHNIRESAFYAFREKALDEIWKFLKQNGIESAATSQKSQDSKKEPTKKAQGHKKRDRSPNKEPDLFRKTEKYTKPKYRISGPLFSKTTKPANIAEALSMKPSVLAEVIIATLKNRPNFSCTKDALPGYVLKYLHVVTRSKPREKFARKVLKILPKLQEESIILVYKSKNVRIKLLDSR